MLCVCVCGKSVTTQNTDTTTSVVTTNVAKQFSESVVRERETGTGSVRERESLAGHSEGEDSSPDDDVSSVTGTLTVVVVGLVGSSPPTMCQHTHHKRALILMTVPVSV